ncbi:MAG TPA: ABC transporter ATP-binding protein [Enterobacteriaceae bacterium]|nr:ABC transporter ATP-binding protein [Enterobacteriaceae bacterium]
MLRPVQPTGALLDVHNLSLSPGGQTRVNSVSFALYPGERVCLIGASGSGKSLTAKAIAGVSAHGVQQSGMIRVNGIDVSQRNALARPQSARVATIFQDSATALNPLMTVGKQLTLALKTTSESLHVLLDAMKLSAIPNLLQRYPAELSGGQRQRICIVLALLGNTRLIVADEPTTALDVITQHEVLQTLKAHSASADAPALLFITHDIAVAAQLCQRGLVMQDGEIIESGTMAQLLNSPQQAYTRSLVSAVRNAEECLRVNPTGALAG